MVLMFLPALTYCLSNATEETAYWEASYPLGNESLKECLIEDYLDNSMLKDSPVNMKLSWLAYILDNQVKLKYSNQKIKSTENNLEQPKNIKLFLISHYLSRHSDLFL